MKLPKSWADITIRKYLEYHSIVTKFKDIDSLDLEVKIIACLGDCTVNEVESLTAGQLMDAGRKLGFLKDMPQNKNIPVKLKVNGKTYRASILFRDMKFVQFRDFNTICKDTKEGEQVYQMHNLIASMLTLRTRGLYIEGGRFGFSKYEYHGYEDTATTLFNHLTMDKAYPYYLFFCKVMENLLPATQSYLKQTNRRLMRQMRKALKQKPFRNTGVGL